ncbi:TPA: AHH domain-containing protein, partial [Citrobacter sedlakii]|nr:AHH domain-containing protein [Citrobacter sedlakii]
RMKEAVLDTPDAAGAGNTRHRVTFTYDPFGRRTEKRSVVTVSSPDDDGVTVTQEVTTFVWEGFRLLGETRNGQPLVYVYEGAGSYTPLARIYGTGDKQRVDYYRCSHNGMPQALTDEDGKLHWRQDVETWGETRSEYADEEGSRWRKIWDGAPEENLRFAGQYLDRETGLHYNTFRYYAPDMGRFITPDPIGLKGGINLYAYAPNPLSWIDPLGLSCSSDAKVLRENMVVAGKVEPGFKNSAHHIVMSNSTDSRMVALQNKMETLKIDINTAENGIFLPSNSKVQLPVGNTLPNHASIHTNAYKQKVFDRLKSINNKDDFLNELNKINSEIAGGIF